MTAQLETVLPCFTWPKDRPRVSSLQSLGPCGSLWGSMPGAASVQASVFLSGKWRMLSSPDSMGLREMRGVQEVTGLQGASQGGTRGQELSPPVPRNFEGQVHKGQAQALPPSPTR